MKWYGRSTIIISYIYAILLSSGLPVGISMTLQV